MQSGHAGRTWLLQRIKSIGGRMLTTLQRKDIPMRLVYGSALAVALVALASPGLRGQGQDTTRSVAGGGISVPGWQGKIDASRENGTLTLNDAKLAKEGDAFHVTTGPSVVYWNPANKASGDYTVKATFTEPKF